MEGERVLQAQGESAAVRLEELLGWALTSPSGHPTPKGGRKLAEMLVENRFRCYILPVQDFVRMWSWRWERRVFDFDDGWVVERVERGLVAGVGRFDGYLEWGFGLAVRGHVVEGGVGWVFGAW